MSSIKSLNKEQRETIGLLSVGTFLEYFDLMLYIHMAVLLNELFFPATDAKTAKLIAGFSFASSYLLRPFGALIFGYIGDKIGRKATVIITTFMMSASCLVMANLPTYAQIGITATWIITICRVVQGLSSLGELIGAEIYIAETIPKNLRNTAVSFLTIFPSLGSAAALGLASIVTTTGLDWRTGFWAGAVIAIIGFIARTRLRETPEFADAKRRLYLKLQEINQSPELLKNNPIVNERSSKKTVLSYFIISCAWPLWFYIAFLLSSDILKTQFHLTANEIIKQNFIVSLINLGGVVTLTWLTTKMHPLKILKYQSLIFWCFIPFYPYVMMNFQSPLQVFLFQISFVLFAPAELPGMAIFLKSFPIFKRFTYVSLIYASGRTVMTLLNTFGLIALVENFGYYGLWCMVLPLMIGYGFARKHFENLERASGEYQ
jgi:MFS family permease